MDGLFWACMGFFIGCVFTETCEKIKKYYDDKNKENIRNLNKEK